MTYQEWIELVEKLRERYINGELTPAEYFKAVVFYAQGVGND